MIKFDETMHWVPQFSESLQRLLPRELMDRLIQSERENPGSALWELLKSPQSRDAFNDTISWIKKGHLMLFHGTRLNDEEVISVKKHGLKPLDSLDRRVRLVRSLSTHPRWPYVSKELENVMEKYRPRQTAGDRENKVFLTLSRRGLVSDFNHYLRYGSEFDQKVAEELLGCQGKRLLTCDGTPRIVKVAVPGDTVLSTANRFGGIDDLIDKGDPPILIDKFFATWFSYMASESDDWHDVGVDSGVMFTCTIPPEWIHDIETLSDEELPQ